MADATPSLPIAEPTGASWVLVEEISHRVANEYTQAIATLALAAADARDPGSREALRSAASRLRAYAEAHRALRAPVGSGLLDLGDYLQTLCKALSSASLRDRGVHLTLIPCEAVMAAERCWRVGLIISELITNAARHAFDQEGGQVRVEVHAVAGEIRCRVSDNGGAKSSSPPRGQGSMVVDSLTRELGGRIQRTFGRRGAHVLLSVPNTIGAIQ